MEVPMKYLWILITITIVLSVSACSLPGMSPEPVIFPTPDLTMTAIYSVLYTTPATPTWTPFAVTETQLSTIPSTNTDTPLPSTATPSQTPIAFTPTYTPLPPTNTSIPPTNTTVPPTNTLIPPSNTPVPTVRSVASISASYLGVAPNIDGNLGEWNLHQYAVTNVTFGREHWDNAADLSGSVMVGWDAHNLYLGVIVIDEDYEQNTGGENLFRGDSLEVLLDTNLGADFYVDTLSPDDFQLGISPGSPVPDENPEAFLWYPTDIHGSRSQVEIRAARTDEGYTVEAAIPWSIFEITPQAGQHYGFIYSVSDNDIDGGIAQQSMISNAATRHLTNPMTWGDLLLSHP
jgi:hypothetical protein